LVNINRLYPILTCYVKYKPPMLPSKVTLKLGKIGPDNVQFNNQVQSILPADVEKTTKILGE